MNNGYIKVHTQQKDNGHILKIFLSKTNEVLYNMNFISTSFNGAKQNVTDLRGTIMKILMANNYMSGGHV